MKILFFVIVVAVCITTIVFFFTDSESLEIVAQKAKTETTNDSLKQDSVSARTNVFKKNVDGGVTQSIIICPKCGHKKNEKMPTDICLLYYECENCKAVLRPQLGDCCVFCTYGDVKCPSMQ